MRAANKIVRTKRRLLVHFGVGEPVHVAYTRNISETGLFLETARIIPPGTDLQLEVEAGDRRFEMWATVVWAKVYPPRLQHVLRGGMGCRFAHSSDDWIAFYERWKHET